MKKLFSSILILGMLTISSCTSDEPMGENNGNTIDTQINNYLTVNIMPTATPTRAEGATDEGDNTEGGMAGKYEDGTELEQQVNTIRFFFFDNAGNGAPVNVITDNNNTTQVSYIDWIHYDSDLGQGDEDITVEATLTATLGLTIPEGYDTPESLIAIVNPSQTVKNLTVEPGTFGPTRSQVQNAVADYETGLTNGNFVMSNSVYANTAVNPAETVNYTNLVTAADEKPYFQSSIEAAQSNPVTIYVERVAARLDLKIALNANSNGYYPVMKKVEGGNDIQVSIDVNGDGEAEPIFVNFLGWNVTSTTAKSYLVKNINPSWKTKDLFGTTNLIWNSMDYHRSFWAMNPNGVTYHYGNFGTPGDQDVSGNYQPARANPMPASGAFAKTYMQENASPFDTSLKPSNPTQVIIAAQLVTGDGTPVKLAEWGYNKYTQPDLLKYLVTNIISKGNYYKLVGGKYETLTDKDLTFVSASQFYGDVPIPDNVKSYYSYIVVDPDLDYTWYQWNGEGEAPNADNLTKVDPSDIDTYIKNNVGYTLMWNNGYTYYYFDVQHLGQEGSPAFYGIVRNHIYRATVNTLYGYGTPVCNPSEIIIPEAPEYEEVILAAEIKILQWRVVSADYTLEWR